MANRILSPGMTKAQIKALNLSGGFTLVPDAAPAQALSETGNAPDWINNALQGQGLNGPSGINPSAPASAMPQQSPVAPAAVPNPNGVGPSRYQALDQKAQAQDAEAARVTGQLQQEYAHPEQEPAYVPYNAPLPVRQPYGQVPTTDSGADHAELLKIIKFLPLISLLAPQAAARLTPIVLHAAATAIEDRSAKRQQEAMTQYQYDAQNKDRSYAGEMDLYNRGRMINQEENSVNQSGFRTRQGAQNSRITNLKGELGINETKGTALLKEMTKEQRNAYEESSKTLPTMVKLLLAQNTHEGRKAVQQQINQKAHELTAKYGIAGNEIPDAAITDSAILTPEEQEKYKNFRAQLVQTGATGRAVIGATATEKSAKIHAKAITDAATIHAGMAKAVEGMRQAGLNGRANMNFQGVLLKLRAGAATYGVKVNTEHLHALGKELTDIRNQLARNLHLQAVVRQSISLDTQSPLYKKNEAGRQAVLRRHNEALQDLKDQQKALQADVDARAKAIDTGYTAMENGAKELDYSDADVPASDYQLFDHDLSALEKQYYNSPSGSPGAPTGANSIHRPRPRPRGGGLNPNGVGKPKPGGSGKSTMIDGIRVEVR